MPHLLANWALNVSDRIILNGQVSNSQLGLYTLGYQFGILLNMVAVALNNAWVPFFYQNTEDLEHRDTIPPFITYQVLLMALLSLAVALLSREVIQIMANRSFWNAYQVVPWIVLGYMARFLYFFPVNGLLYTKRTKWTMIATLIAAAVNISLNLWLVPQYGIMAAAVNTFIGFLVLLVIIFVVGRANLSRQVRDKTPGADWSYQPGVVRDRLVALTRWSVDAHGGQIAPGTQFPCDPLVYRIFHHSGTAAFSAGREWPRQAAGLNEDIAMTALRLCIIANPNSIHTQRWVRYLSSAAMKCT